MAKENVVTFEKKADCLISLLTIVGAEKLGVDDRGAMIEIARNPLYKDVCKSIASACDVLMAHLEVIKVFMQ